MTSDRMDQSQGSLLDLKKKKKLLQGMLQATLKESSVNIIMNTKRKRESVFVVFDFLFMIKFWENRHFF